VDRNGTGDIGDVVPLGFTFASLIVSDSRNRPGQMEAGTQVNDHGVVNFKKFRKVSPTFSPRPPISFVPHTLNINRMEDADLDVGMEAPVSAPARARRVIRAQEAAQPTRAWRNAPVVVAQAVVEEEEDDFSFH